ncbi:24852_t:CDS:1, partial [Gigaspora margarita]
MYAILFALQSSVIITSGPIIDLRLLNAIIGNICFNLFKASEKVDMVLSDISIATR